MFISNRAQTSRRVLEDYIVNEVHARGNTAVSAENVAYALDTRSSLVYSSWCRELCQRNGLRWHEHVERGLLTFHKEAYH